MVLRVFVVGCLGIASLGAAVPNATFAAETTSTTQNAKETSQFAKPSGFRPAHRDHAPGPVSRPISNAIGVAVGSKAAVLAGSSNPQNPQLTQPMRTPPTLTGVDTAAARSVIVQPTVTMAKPNLPVSPTVPNRGTINGTTLIHPGFAPAIIGGPAKAAAVVNGTTLRPKH